MDTATNRVADTPSSGPGQQERTHADEAIGRHHVADQDCNQIRDLLSFLRTWFEEDEEVVEQDLVAWTGHGPCRVRHLIADMDCALAALHPSRHGGDGLQLGGTPAYHCLMGAMVPGTLRFRDPVEREQARILAARLLIQIARHKHQPIDPQIAADALRPLPKSGMR